MKNAFRLTLLAATMAVNFVACEKPDEDKPDSGANNERVIIYAVDGNETRRTLTTESEWDAVLEQLCNLAQNGKHVTFYNINQTAHRQSAAKERSTINTASREELKDWMKKMEKKGLTVRVSFDDESGTWHGEAYTTLPAENTLGNILGAWHLNCMVVSQLDADDRVVNSDLYEPDTDGGAMYYTFSNDGTLTVTVNGIDGTTGTDNGIWTLSEAGILSSEMLPNGVDWNVNWITPNTMILSRKETGTENGSTNYQLQFESVGTVE